MTPLKAEPKQDFSPLGMSTSRLIAKIETELDERSTSSHADMEKASKSWPVKLWCLKT